MDEQFKKFIIKYIWVVIILFCLRCLISGENLISNFSAYDIFGYAGEAIGVSSFIMVLYERKLWKYSPFEDTPILYKKYTGTISSSYDGNEYSASLKIKQTLLTLKIIFISDESRSKSVCYSIDDLYGEKRLTYCYLNEPNASVRNRSSIHYGTAMLCLDDTNELIGQYFTDRKTTGDMKFKSENNS
ncbi:hypothetical protein [Clostridium paraputrificum]|uniref:CD-NTase-associated protein 15 domain-containing protein n=1 Tax=Clostridium paraputrificum TaxID=29363 RepID=A0A6N2Y8M2_9CLOT